MIFHTDVSKSRGTQPAAQLLWEHWHERAAEMRDARKPAILNFKRHKNAARLEHSKDFRESSILRVTGAQVMQHQHSDRGGKCVRFERQN
jgi:hypothetical protein